MPGKTKKQRSFAGLVHAYQKGKVKASELKSPEKVKQAASSMTQAESAKMSRKPRSKKA